MILYYEKKFVPSDIVFAAISDCPAVDSKKDTPAVLIYQVTTFIHHISDINYREGQYKIERWLQFSQEKLSENRSTSKTVNNNQKIFVQRKDDSVPYELIDQLEVNDAKENDIAYIAMVNDSLKASVRRKAFKVNCTLINKWTMSVFHFGDQALNIYSIPLLQNPG